MARSRVGLKKCNQRKNQQRDEDTDESDEEYKVTDDEDFDESDERYSIDGDESEEISSDFGKSMRVSRSRNTRRTSSSKKVNEIKKKPRKRRRVSYTEDDNDADEDDAEYVALNWKTNQANKPIEKKKVSYTGMDDDDDNGGDDGEDYEEVVFSGRNRKQRKNHRKKKRVAYTEDDDDEEEVVADEDDAEFMSWDIEANQVNKPMERKRDSYTEMDDDDDGGGDDDGDDDYEEIVFTGRSRIQRKKPREKKSVVYTDDDDDDDHDNEQVDGEDDAECMSFGRKANQIKTPTAMRRDSFTEKDDDDDDDDDGGGGDDDEDDYAYVSSGRKRNQREKLQAKKVVYTEVDEDKDGADDEYMYSGRKVNQKMNLRGKSGVSYTKEEEEDDDNDDEDGDGDEDEDEDEDEYLYSRSKVNQKKKNLRGKSGVIYTEEEDDDDNDDQDEDEDEYMYSSRKVNQKKNLRGKREVSYTEEEEEEEEEEEDDSGFMSSSRKRNQINKRREKRVVSYKEDNQEEEDESDAEFKVSESDFVDDEDESPKIKKHKVTRSHPQKKNVQKKTKKSKTKNSTKPKQRNHRSGQKSSSSKQKSDTNKTKMENQSKISKRRKRRADWQRPTVESDSDFVSSASSDHEYTISEEEREQMREAKVYCANLRDKLRSSSCGNQEKQPTYEQKKYPIRKGKEKIEDLKDDIGKQVCGICLSEEQKRTMRGVLNCCRHYFCFSCIMEWSKVESRCPLCKQRFTTITKAAKSDTGFDLRTTVIPVPECDQVYEPSEEELRGYLDPYENVMCTECQNGGDDALMLLCDICDSSAHTFCVGLGREVPEGNWYCEGCRPTVFGTLNSERRLSNNAPDLSSPSPIPGGFDLNELYVPETPLTQQTRVHTEPNPVSTGPAATATTLRDRRRLHRQIHHLGILNNNNRMNDLVGRSSGGTSASSSSGIRLFGSQLDEARVSVSQNDHIFPSMHDPSNFYPRADQFSAQVQNSNLASADVALPEFKIG